MKIRPEKGAKTRKERDKMKENLKKFVKRLYFFKKTWYNSGIKY